MAGGIDLSFGDHDSVANIVAKQRFTGEEPFVEWDALSRRAKRRLGYHANRWLNTRIVEAMTPELLSDRDSRGEVINWMWAVVALMR